MTDLKNEIHDYWTNRARGYSEYNQQEMADARRTMWRDKLLSLLGEAFPEREPEEIKILDVGTGPGFFAILLAEAGYPDGQGFPTVEYMTNDAKYHKPIAEYLQSAWKELGINTDIKPDKLEGLIKDKGKEIEIIQGKAKCVDMHISKVRSLKRLIAKHKVGPGHTKSNLEH